MLFEACGDGAKVFEFIEEAFDEVSLFVEFFVEPRDVHAVRHGLDVGLGAAFGQGNAQGIAVIGAVGEQGLAGADTVQHILGAAAVMGLALGQLQGERIAVGIDHRMDFGGQSAS